MRVEKVAGLHPGRNDSEGRWSVMYQKSKEKKFNNYYLCVRDIREKLMITIATADIESTERRTIVRRLALWNGWICMSMFVPVLRSNNHSHHLIVDSTGSTVRR